MYNAKLISQQLLENCDGDERYRHSVFAELRNLHPKVKGARLERITSEILQHLGHAVSAAENTDYDRVVNGLRTEFKGGFLNTGKNHFSFLQIRPHQEYDQIMFTLCYPKHVIIMCMTKQQVSMCCKNGDFKKQHGGKHSQANTFMFYGNEHDLEKLGATHIT